MTVNKEALREWVKELRSGKYSQARGALRTEKGYCCLGVACDISKLGEWTPLNNYRVKYTEKMGSLPPLVQDYYGVNDMVRISDSTVREVLGDEFLAKLRARPPADYYSANLANINDLGATFSDIADIIEIEFNLCT